MPRRTTKAKAAKATLLARNAASRETGASIDPGDTEKVVGDGSQGYQHDKFRTGIVLVVDTSVSMQPYIDRVAQVVDELHKQIARRVAVKIAEQAKEMSGKFPNIVVQNT